jgi:hypothetical protein
VRGAISYNLCYLALWVGAALSGGKNMTSSIPRNCAVLIAAALATIPQAYGAVVMNDASVLQREAITKLAAQDAQALQAYGGLSAFYRQVRVIASRGEQILLTKEAADSQSELREADAQWSANAAKLAEKNPELASRWHTCSAHIESFDNRSATYTFQGEFEHRCPQFARDWYEGMRETSTNISQEADSLDFARLRELTLRELARARAHPVRAPTQPVPNKALLRLIAVTDIADGDPWLAHDTLEELRKNDPQLVANMANCNAHLALEPGSDNALPNYAGGFATSCPPVWQSYEQAFEIGAAAALVHRFQRFASITPRNQPKQITASEIDAYYYDHPAEYGMRTTMFNHPAVAVFDFPQIESQWDTCLAHQDKRWADQATDFPGHMVQSDLRGGNFTPEFAEACERVEREYDDYNSLLGSAEKAADQIKVARP